MSRKRKSKPANPVTLRKESVIRYTVLFGVGLQSNIGEMIQDVDGYFYYFPIENGGAWTPWIMRLIADKMDELNKRWDDTVGREVGHA